MTITETIAAIAAEIERLTSRAEAAEESLRSIAFFLGADKKAIGDVMFLRQEVEEALSPSLTPAQPKCPECGAWLGVQRTDFGEFNCADCKHRWPIPGEPAQCRPVPPEPTWRDSAPAQPDYRQRYEALRRAAQAIVDWDKRTTMWSPKEAIVFKGLVKSIEAALAQRGEVGGEATNRREP